MTRTIHAAPNGVHYVEVVGRRPLFTYSHPLHNGRIIFNLQAENLEELAAAHSDIGEYLTKNGYPAFDAEPPAFDPEYVAEALRSTLRATSFEGGVGEDLVEDFIASYEKAVEDGARP